VSDRPLGDVVAMVQLGPAEEVGQCVVHSRPVLRVDGHVVLAGDGVELS